MPKTNKSQVRTPPPAPVTTEQMPWARCTVCEKQVFYRAGRGAAGTALTEHYSRLHAGELASA